MIVGSYPCCGGSLRMGMPDRTPAYLPEDCPHCGNRVWHLLSKAGPVSWTEEDFLAEFEVDEETRTVRPRQETDMTEEPIPGRYRHFKGGEYVVLGVARHSETHERMVVYGPLYGEGGLWVRPVGMFLEAVDGKSVPRFAYLGPMEKDQPRRDAAEREV